MGKRKTWLERFMWLAEQVPKGFVFGGEEIKAGEKEIGKLPANLVVLHRTLKWYTANLKSEIGQHWKTCKEDGDCKEFHRRVAIDIDELKAIKAILAASVRYELNISGYDYPKIDVRGETVVSLPPRPSEKEARINIFEIFLPFGGESLFEMFRKARLG